MTPYTTGCKAMIDPTISVQNLMFGSVQKKHYQWIGIIMDQKYCKPRGTQIYALKFKGEDEVLWFAEKELIAFTR